MNVATDKIVSTAKFMAHTGINIKFVPDTAFNAENINALYKRSQNTIYINATKGDSNKTFDQLIVHETAHALYKVPKYRKLMKKLAKKLDKKTQEEVESLYGTTIKRQAFTSKEDVLKDEFAAHYLEYALGKEGMLESLLKEDVSLVEALRNHIKKGEKLFGGDERLDAASKRVYKKFKKALANFSESNKGFNAYKGDKGGEVRYSIKYPHFSDEDIQRNMETIADMDVVTTIDASKLEKTGKSPMDTFTEYFNSLGNNIATETFGDIALPKSSVKSEIRHGITAEKIASIEAIPSVIEQGKVIFFKKKAGTDVDRIVIAAPIKIGEADYYMGVMLQRDTQNQRLYLHNVVAIKTEEATTPSQDDSLTNWSDESNSRLFISSILQKAINVKVERQKNANSFSTDIRRQSVSKVGEGANQASKRTYSYNELVAKGNLTGVVVDKSQQVKIKTAPDGTVKIDDAYIQSEVRKQCEVLHREKGNPVYYVKVSDIGETVEITSKGVRHGYFEGLKSGIKSIPNKALINAKISLKLPDLLRNSIETNISDRSDSIDVNYAHVMIGTVGVEASNGTIDYYAVRSVIEERTNQNPILAEYEIVGKLHALNAKKISSATVSGTKNGVAGAAFRAYKYNIPQFLDDVKGVFDDTFSNDVYSHFGLTRRSTPFSGPLRYSLTPVSPAAEGGESFNDPAKNSVTLTVDKDRKSFFAALGEGFTNTAVALTDAQAGITRMGRSVGMTRNEIETSLQWARLANAQANNFIGGNFSRMNGNETLDQINEAQDGKENAKLTGGVSDALLKVMPKKFSKKGNTKAEQRYADFQLVGQHLNNIDRMSLEENAKKKYLPQELVLQNLKSKRDTIATVKVNIREKESQYKALDALLKEEQSKGSPDESRIKEYKRKMGLLRIYFVVRLFVSNYLAEVYGIRRRRNGINA